MVEKPKLGELLMSAANYDPELKAALAADGDAQGNVDRYREQARRLRRLAISTRFPEVRQQLMSLAFRYERIAGWIEARGGCGQASD